MFMGQAKDVLDQERGLGWLGGEWRLVSISCLTGVEMGRKGFPGS